MPTRCNRWFLYCRSHCLLNMFRTPLCPSSGAQEYYTGGYCLWHLVQNPANRTHNPQLVSLLQILLLAQHVSGTIMPIIRSSRVLYRWLLPVAFGAASRKPDTQPTALHQTNKLKTTARNTTGSNHLYSTLEILMMGIVMPETC